MEKNLRISWWVLGGEFGYFLEWWENVVCVLYRMMVRFIYLRLSDDRPWIYYVDSLFFLHTRAGRRERERESNSVDEEEDSTRCPRLCGWGVASFFWPFFLRFFMRVGFCARNSHRRLSFRIVFRGLSTCVLCSCLWGVYITYVCVVG
jgi:hypothetical protein